VVAERARAKSCQAGHRSPNVLGGDVAQNDNAVQSGAGRVRLRPIRGFQRCLACEVNPQK
jgi:hypothetical protein